MTTVIAGRWGWSIDAYVFDIWVMCSCPTKYDIAWGAISMARI